MIFLRYSISPGPDHPHHGRIGEGLVRCWVDRPTVPKADRVARAAIVREHWVVLEREEARAVNEADYAPDDDCLRLYREALLHSEVYDYHTSPRFPVYWVNAPVEGEGEVAEAHYFLCNEALREDGDDVYDPAFWDGGRDDIVFRAAVEAIEEAGWRLTAPPEGRPCGRNDVSDDMVAFYDEAEGPAPVLVFVREGENG